VLLEFVFSLPCLFGRFRHVTRKETILNCACGSLELHRCRWVNDIKMNLQRNKIGYYQLFAHFFPQSSQRMFGTSYILH
jgi:hypothetical protein